MRDSNLNFRRDAKIGAIAPPIKMYKMRRCLKSLLYGLLRVFELILFLLSVGSTLLSSDFHRLSRNLPLFVD